MAVVEYPHFFGTWEGYPRVLYFHSRLKDLFLRFKKILRALPERFHLPAITDTLEDLCSCFTNFLQVTVVGNVDLEPRDLIVSETALQKHELLSASSHIRRIHICICYAKVGHMLDDTGLQEISVAVNYLSTEFFSKIHGLCFVIIVCETESDVSQDETEVFRSKVHLALQGLKEQGQYDAEILIGRRGIGLQNVISNVLEKKIIDGFNEIYTFLQRFLRKEIRYDQEDMNILESDTVVNEIRGFFQSGMALVDAKRIKKDDIPLMELILQTLSSRIMCAAVSPLASKFNLPDWVCHGLLEELKFDKDLKESISRNTQHHLKRFEEYIRKLEQMVVEGTEYTHAQGTCHSFDFLLYQLQKDLVEAVVKVEMRLAAMNRLTIVMRKMSFEVRGYLKQTTVAVDIAEIGQRELTSEDITDKLQEDIMRTSGVYGMGTLFGQLEIHLKMGLPEPEVKDAKHALADVLKRFQFHHPYIVRTIENDPKQLARFFFEQGDMLCSAFPDNAASWRMGTLGCFLKGSDGELYAVTCAHVVDPHNKLQHEVHITKHDSSYVFAVSSPVAIFYGHQLENGELCLADFAAIKVLKQVQGLCNANLKDEFGNNKPARIFNEPSKDLIGSYVYKYGAKSGLTKGIIATDKYVIGSLKSKENIMIIEPLPEPSEDICGKFSEGKDNGLPASSQESKLSVETPLAFMEESEITDMLNDDVDQAVPDEGSFDMQPDSSIQESCDDMVECEIEDGKGCTCIKLPNIQPRPEIETGHECNNRDTETIYMRNANENATIPLSDMNSLMPVVGPFAVQGDSGSIVCKPDLHNNKIVAVSMITAGDFSFRDDKSESKQCVSVRLDQSLATLKERLNIDFDICSL